jgi:hypothetical protein
LPSAALNAALQVGKMKFVKPFSKTFHSENLALDSSPALIKERGDESLIDSGEKGGEGIAPVFHWIGLEVQVSRRPQSNTWHAYAWT